jgi:hypothetical protein
MHAFLGSFCQTPGRVHADEGKEPHNWADLPLAFAVALMAVTAGQIYYLHAPMQMGPHENHLEHFRRPNPLDLLAITIGSHAAGREFTPAVWFGAEIS